MNTRSKIIRVIELVHNGVIYYAEGFWDGEKGRYLVGMCSAVDSATDYSCNPEELIKDLAVLERSLKDPQCQHDGMGITSYRVVEILITIIYREIVST